MKEITVSLPETILSVPGASLENLSTQVRQLVALELYRERLVSLGKAAEIAGLCTEEFLDLASQRSISMDYTLDDLEADRKTIQDLGL